jgi:hypothetical protein
MEVEVEEVEEIEEVEEGRRWWEWEEKEKQIPPFGWVTTPRGTPTPTPT